MATLNFRSKSYIKNHHLTVKYHELLADNTASLNPNPNLNDNLILHGDNLVALKSLLPIYAGKVKCIYIDPPYNTGNEGWRYSDNVNSPIIRRWLHDNRPVDREDETRHDKWLCMMMPRLYLLRELLRDDGVIFISIDDNELHHLRMLLDEVFGENNFLAIFLWKRRTGSNDSTNFVSSDHEYVISYTKSPDISLNGLLKDFANYINPDNDPRGAWARDNLTCNKTAEERPNLFYPITDPKTGIVYACNPNRVWAYEPERMARNIAEGKVLFPASGKGTPQYKRHLNEVRSTRKPVSTWIEASTRDQTELVSEQFEDDISVMQVPLNAQATKELRAIFQSQTFNYPKPVELISELLRQATKADEGDIILDSFAGSGTTGQAVLELNREDGGNRRFILVEMEDYADSLTAERLRRVIRGVPGAKDEKLQKGLGGTFSFFRLGSALDTEGILSGERLPTYLEMARYLFYTATAEQFDPALVREADNFIGESSHYVLYLIYEPKVEFLKTAALTLDFARSLPPSPGKKRVVFAPAKYLDNEYLEELNLEYAQLPYEIFRFQT